MAAILDRRVTARTDGDFVVFLIGPAWVDFDRRMKDSLGAVGIRRETYCVRAGEYESVYSGMPLSGLAGAAGAAATVAAGFESARERLGAGA